MPIYEISASEMRNIKTLRDDLDDLSGFSYEVENDYHLYFSRVAWTVYQDYLLAIGNILKVDFDRPESKYRVSLTQFYRETKRQNFRLPTDKTTALIWEVLPSGELSDSLIVALKLNCAQIARMCVEISRGLLIDPLAILPSPECQINSLVDYRDEYGHFRQVGLDKKHRIFGFGYSGSWGANFSTGN